MPVPAAALHTPKTQCQQALIQEKSADPMMSDQCIATVKPYKVEIILFPNIERKLYCHLLGGDNLVGRAIYRQLLLY